MTFDHNPKNDMPAEDARSSFSEFWFMGVTHNKTMFTAAGADVTDVVGEAEGSGAIGFEQPLRETQLLWVIERLHADIESDEVIQKVRNDQRGGNASGVRSTPAVFINGRLLSQPSADRIIEAVDEEFIEAEAAD